MALHLSVLLLFTGVTGIDCTIQTVSKVSVKAGRSISVPCLYESQYTHHVKYLCRGDHFGNCYTEVKTNQQNSSGKFSISDDKHQRIFTLTFNNQSVDDTNYWCAVERNDGPHDAKRFQLSVTRGSPQLSVDHQEITGFNGDDVTIHFKYNISGKIQWCRLGWSCVKEQSGSLNGARVTINVNVTDFTVTLSGLRTESSGWYLCTKGDLQMPVHVTVKERPSTSKYHTTKYYVSISSLIIIGTLSLALLILVASFIWFMWRRHKQRNAQSPAATVPEEEVTYINVKRTRKTPHKADAVNVDVSTLAL
ncbi:hypothetical protein D5F01_LYC17976 [Larimichthys crocea]|uniref:Immunoglobulin domain-containing protein n=1 Tax=Larimichthys crocea TaxID=215358 RepID=A0A6G0I050_LARCR|nr:hypothetical protein D5F01_LYC17976 [Larimichthys crocea]